jgi:hypothetical protein
MYVCMHTCKYIYIYIYLCLCIHKECCTKHVQMCAHHAYSHEPAFGPLLLIGIMCTCVCMYVCMYDLYVICTNVCIDKFKRAHTTHTHMSAGIGPLLLIGIFQISTPLTEYSKLYVCMYVCMYICMYTYMNVCKHCVCISSIYLRHSRNTIRRVSACMSHALCMYACMRECMYVYFRYQGRDRVIFCVCVCTNLCAYHFG